MGFNFTGITIDKNFEKDPKEVLKFLGLPLTFEKAIDFESGTGFKDGDYFDIFFSEMGTSIYTYEPFQIDPTQSKDCSVLSYMVSETAMAFYMSLDKFGTRIREVIDHEGDISSNIGEPLEIEKDNHLMEAIIKQKEIMFGHNFYQMPLDYQGYRYKIANVTPEDIYKAPFYDSNSLASNPGRMSLNFFQWIKMNFTSVFKNTVFLMVAALLMIKIHWLFGIIFLGSFLYNVWYWFGAYNKFKAGDVNPGKGISINPDRVAVATNMTKFGEHFPILRIIETKLPKFEKEVGMYIPTVALYGDNPYEYPFWAEFHPVPISHGTTDKGILKARFETFTQEDFNKLDKYISEVNTILEGTYRVEKETSGWKDYPDVEVGSITKMKAPEKNNET